MNELLAIVLFTIGAGVCIPLGGLLASVEAIGPRWLENELRHGVIAFGGGVLLAAVALVLVPEGTARLPHPLLGFLILTVGGVTFFMLERFLGARRRERPQFSAMLLDYIPESLALGGAFAMGMKSAPLIAIFIGLQNLPEGFNAFRELLSVSGIGKRRIIGFMLLLVPIGPVMAIIGWSLFSGHAALVGATMLFASGGILYLIFQDIAPQAHMRSHWGPPLGAVLGFGLGMLGTALINGV